MLMIKLFLSAKNSKLWYIWLFNLKRIRNKSVKLCTKILNENELKDRILELHSSATKRVSSATNCRKIKKTIITSGTYSLRSGQAEVLVN